MQTMAKTMIRGDELNILGESYCTKYKDGKTFDLGRLLTRTKFYSPFHEAYSAYNNVFVFEHKPDKTQMVYPEDNWHNTPLFFLKNADKHCIEIEKIYEGGDIEQGLPAKQKIKAISPSWWNCFFIRVKTNKTT